MLKQKSHWNDLKFLLSTLKSDSPNKHNGKSVRKTREFGGKLRWAGDQSPMLFYTQ